LRGHERNGEGAEMNQIEVATIGQPLDKSCFRIIYALNDVRHALLILDAAAEKTAQRLEAFKIEIRRIEDLAGAIIKKKEVPKRKFDGTLKKRKW
jgi:hypothetical protein